jgi:hypothetical protein
MAAATASLTTAPERRVSVPAALMILLAIRSTGISFTTQVTSYMELHVGGTPHPSNDVRTLRAKVGLWRFCYQSGGLHAVSASSG